MHPVGRLATLDGLRGLAALSVVLCHVVNVSPTLWDAASAHVQSDHIDGLTRVLTFSPAHLAWAGGEAVLLFFILSGYVLALPAFGATPQRYSQFVVRRVCRIYMPYAVVVTIAALMLAVSTQHGDASLSDWFNSQWRHSLTANDAISLALMLGGEPSTNVDGPTWSLVQEMRISLIFPALLFVATRLSWRVTLSVAIWISVLAALALPPLPFDLQLTVRYAPLFLTGALLARSRDALRQRMQRMPLPQQAIWLALALTLYIARWLWPLADAVQDLAVGAGAAMLLVSADHFRSVGSLLQTRSVAWLGKVSYSLYLIHCPILFALMYALRGHLPVWAILVLAVLVALIAAEVLHRVVEVPSIRLGRRYRRDPTRPAARNSVQLAY